MKGTPAALPIAQLACSPEHAGGVSELVVLAGTGHVPTLTRPAEVVQAIERWAATLA